MKNKPAGGPGSRVVKKVSAPKVEPRAKAVNPRGASQIGQSLGNHAEGGKVSAGKAVEPLYAGRVFDARWREYQLEAGAVRQLRNGQHGPVAGATKPQGRDILSDFGPDSPAVGPRR